MMTNHVLALHFLPPRRAQPPAAFSAMDGSATIGAG
jgi:hypothetical protein